MKTKKPLEYKNIENFNIVAKDEKSITVSYDIILENKDFHFTVLVRNKNLVFANIYPGGGEVAYRIIGYIFNTLDDVALDVACLYEKDKLQNCESLTISQLTELANTIDNIHELKI